MDVRMLYIVDGCVCMYRKVRRRRNRKANNPTTANYVRLCLHLGMRGSLRICPQKMIECTIQQGLWSCALETLCRCGEKVENPGMGVNNQRDMGSVRCCVVVRGLGICFE